MWNERYRTNEYMYGKEPNDFLRQTAENLQPGRILCLAEGEGRNAVFLAEKGHTVTAVDLSDVGLKKALVLAEERGVKIDTEVADLAGYEISAESWDAIVSIFCHLPPHVRKALHRKVVNGLKPGGIFILEGYTPRQLGLGTGGPPNRELMMTLDELKEELSGLDFEHALETRRGIVEGSLHTGVGEVVQLIGRKPG